MHPVDIRRFIAGDNLAAARPAFRRVNADQIQFAGRQGDKITKDLTAPQIRRCLAEFINEGLPRLPRTLRAGTLTTAGSARAAVRSETGTDGVMAISGASNIES
jgi:hypothetical protein